MRKIISRINKNRGDTHVSDVGIAALPFDKVRQCQRLEASLLQSQERRVTETKLRSTRHP